MFHNATYGCSKTSFFLDLFVLKPCVETANPKQTNRTTDCEKRFGLTKSTDISANNIFRQQTIGVEVSQF